MIRSVLAATVAALVLAAPAAASHFQPGAPGLGDPFFPLAGNGGYDVRHYALDLEYESIERLNLGIATCRDLGDNGTRELLEHILKGEEHSANELEEHLHIVQEIGKEHYLAQQIS